MPIYMDRHDFAGATAETAADAHRRDIAIQDQYGVKFLTYWFDEARGAVFCLVDAPDKETANRVHQDAHGAIANVMVEVELSAVEAFLGRISDPAPLAPGQEVQLESAFRTVMFTDIVGSTEMTTRLGDRSGVEIVRAHDSLVRRALAKHGGREVKHTGDGIMASFFEVASAIECAEHIQQSVAEFNRSNRESIHLRIGLHAGEPVEDSHDLFGTTVQMAARICQAAPPGTIVVSDEVRSAVPDGPAWIELGTSHLKGFPAPVPLFQVQGRSRPA